MDLQLKGKTAIVTGGSKGIGKAVAKALAGEGVKVAIVARDRAALDAAASEIARDTGAEAKGFAADTGDDAQVKAMVADVVKAFGRIDILVNCAAQAGGQKPPPKLAEVTNEDFTGDMNVKVMGYLRTAREVAPIMAKTGGGRIVNISGLAARNTGTIIGSMRNVAVQALTKNLADQLSPLGIAVLCVHPAVTQTEKSAALNERNAKAQGKTVQEFETQLANRTLARRLITAEDIAYVVTCLASPRAVAINGDSIAAGGGQPGSIYY